MEKKLVAQKNILVEKMGVHFEKKDNLAPVAARILAYIVLTGKKGTTFEDLVSELCASKSTISTHLTHLQGIKKIEYFTKTGDRKKYFTINNDSFLQGINDMLLVWQQQKELHTEVKEYKLNANSYLSKEDQFNLDLHDSYINYLDDAIRSITILKQKIEQSNQEQNK